MLERLQKALAAAGIGSRRACEAWITEGRVRVNGQVVTELGTKVDLDTDQVTFNNRLVRQPRKRYYIAVNKPRGVVSSRQDAHAGRLVTDLVDLGDKPMLRPVGRLDADSEGLIFLTDDGDFLYKLTHPRYHVPKTYRAEVKGIPTPERLNILRRGIILEDGPTQPAEGVRMTRSTPKAGEAGLAEIELTIFEGRNRQVRRMMAAIGHPVIHLTRVRIGSIRLTGLPSGAWRHLTPKEVEALTVAIPSNNEREHPTPATSHDPSLGRKGKNAELTSTLSVPTPPSLAGKGAGGLGSGIGVSLPKTSQEKPASWPIPPPLTPPKAPSSSPSLRTTRPLPLPTSLNSPGEDSTTD